MKLTWEHLAEQVRRAVIKVLNAGGEKCQTRPTCNAPIDVGCIDKLPLHKCGYDGQCNCKEAKA